MQRCTYFQSTKHYSRLAGRARVSVFHLLLHGLKQPLVVSGRCNGLGPNVLHRAEGFRPQVQIMETSLEQHISIAGHAGIYIEKAKRKTERAHLLHRVLTMCRYIDRRGERRLQAAFS